MAIRVWLSEMLRPCKVYCIRFLIDGLIGSPGFSSSRMILILFVLLIVLIYEPKFFFVSQPPASTDPIHMILINHNCQWYYHYH